MSLASIILIIVSIVVTSGIILTSTFGVLGWYNNELKYCSTTQCNTTSMWYKGMYRNISIVSIQLKELNRIYTDTYYTQTACRLIPNITKCYKYFEGNDRYKDNFSISSIRYMNYNGLYYLIIAIVFNLVLLIFSFHCVIDKQLYQNILLICILLFMLIVTVLGIVILILGTIGIFNNTKDMCKLDCTIEQIINDKGILINITKRKISTNYFDYKNHLLSLHREYYDYDNSVCPYEIPCYYSNQELNDKMIPELYYLFYFFGIFLIIGLGALFLFTGHYDSTPINILTNILNKLISKRDYNPIK